MDFISTILKTFQGSNKIDSAKHVEISERQQVLAVVQPAGRLCRLFGLFPFTFSTMGPDHTICLKQDKGGWFLYSLIIFLIATVYMIFQIGSFLICLHREPVHVLLAQSIWFICGLSPYLLSIFIFLRGKAVVQLFEEWSSIERDLAGLFCPIRTRSHARRFEVLYFTMSISSIVLCGYHALKRPNTPVYPFYYMKEYSEASHMVYVAYQMVMLGWIWAGLTIFEGICCLFATVIGQCMTTLVVGLEFNFNKRMHQNDKSLHPESRPASYFEDDMTVKNHDEFMRAAVHTILMNRPEVSHGERDESKTKTPFELTDEYKEEYLLFVVKELQTVGVLQSKVNRIMGPLLFLNVGQIVILVCIMIFLPIRYVHKLDGFDAMVTFLGNGVAVLFRLVIFMVCLGRVYSSGQEVNLALAHAMISTKLSTACQNPVLAYLSVFSSNPITFTAWDFFPITRGTLLTAFSVISTYAVVFLQSNF